MAVPQGQLLGFLMAKERGALASLLGFGGKKSDPAESADGARYSKGKEPTVDDDADMASEPDADEDDSDVNFMSFAEAVGIPQAKRATAEAALKRYMMSCMESSKTEE
jgi:hypothetical protein